jgi:hypothetical protein
MNINVIMIIIVIKTCCAMKLMRYYHMLACMKGQITGQYALYAVDAELPAYLLP